MKRLVLFSLLAFALAGLLLRPDMSAQACRDALSLCAQTVVPSLFPFFVLSSLLVSGGSADAVSALLGGVMRPLFGLGGAGASALALGLLGGYPVGARTAAELYGAGALEKREAECLLGFCNNAGPGFILGICGGAVLHSPRAGLYLYLVHVASALLTGIPLCRDLPRRGAVYHKPANAANAAPFASLFSAAVRGALTGILNVCAFVALFLVLLRLLAAALPAAVSVSPLYPLLLGFVELTNGVTALSPTRGGFVLCAVLLAWGGLSVHAQTLSVLDGTALSTRFYWRGKMLQAALSAPLAYLVSFRLF